VAALLEVREVSKSYGSLVVVSGVSFSLEPGEVLGILGPNGAGKTTLFNLISGDVAPQSGAILLGDTDVTRLPPHERCRRGVGRSYQIARPFGGLTVFENVLVGALFGGGGTNADANLRCADVLKLTGLFAKAERLARSLTLLDRKRLEFARALATNPKVLLLDEIAGGLTEPEAREVADIVRTIRARDIAIVWIEHVVHALLAVATRLLVMHQGAKLVEGEPRAIIESPQVRRIYMGIEA
jgi:branched-chain amino acid transport system ATP-binding protein